MATLQSVLSLTKVNTWTYFLATSLAIFLTIVTAGQASGDGGHAGPSVSDTGAPTVACALRENARKFFRQRGLLSQGAGQFAETMLAELWRNESTGEWAWTVTGPDGITCIMLTGQSWGGGV